MRIYSLIVFLSISRLLLADDVDRIKIFLNGKLVANITEGNKLTTTINFHFGDTLMIDAWTDRGLLENATLDVVNNLGAKLLTIEKQKDGQYGARFYYILD